MADFIQTEEFGIAGEQAEKLVWEAVKEAFAGREALAFWRYPLSDGQASEPDILILDAELGIVIIEVKALPLRQIKRFSGYEWELNWPYFGKNAINPHQQAKNQLRKALDHVRQRPGLSRVPGRVLVALPLVTRDEWEDSALDTLVSDTPMLLGDQLSKAKLLRIVERATLVAQGDLLDERQWERLQRAFSTSGHIKKTDPEREEEAAAAVAEAKKVQQAPPQPSLMGTLQRMFGTAAPKLGLPKRTRGELVRLVTDAPSPADIQQDRIAKTVPPGPQRIRGLAGSGKTVLLAQKAAVMHLKHPEWDIAFVFFSRALYAQIKHWINHWLKVLSNGEVTLADAGSKIRVLHAWGGANQAGFYSVLADHAGVRPLTPGMVPKKFDYALGLMYACKKLIEVAEEKQVDLRFFDAVLIDEGQDLIAEDPELHFQERQAIYWLAYQALRPVEQQQPLLLGDDVVRPELKRLVWAYDEAQSLDNLIIPDIRTVFGESVEEIFGSGPVYSGGISKYEVMKVCYRVPGPTLIAAHALGMGLMRPGGMLSGPTRKGDWEKLGYTVVQGDFRTSGPIVITREDRHSPHVLPTLTYEPLVSFSSQESREAEMAALVSMVQRDIAEGLSPSKQILIIHLGVEGILGALNKAFKAAGLDYYCAGKPGINQYYGKGNPNDFWHPGAITVSGVHQAKGNEAESVYVIGADKVAQNEADIQVRNHLFVAMSRSKGWVHLSGVGIAGTSFAREVEEVLHQGSTLTFLPSQPKRMLNDNDTDSGEGATA
ncbi:ATP-binding domain-containing protein [Deinococcus wulumuqiensis]